MNVIVIVLKKISSCRSNWTSCIPSQSKVFSSDFVIYKNKFEDTIGVNRKSKDKQYNDQKGKEQTLIYKTLHKNLKKGTNNDLQNTTQKHKERDKQ